MRGTMTERSGEGEQRGEDKEKVGKVAKGVGQLGLERDLTVLPRSTIFWNETDLYGLWESLCCATYCVLVYVSI